MNVDRSAFLAMTVALSACHHATAPQPAGGSATNARAVASVTVTVAVPPKSDAATANDPCAVLAEENDAILEHPTGTCVLDASDEPQPSYGLTANQIAEAEPKMRAEMIAAKKDAHACFRGAKGTWAFVLESASLDTPSGEHGLSCGWSASYKWTYQTDENSPLRAGAASQSAAWTTTDDYSEGSFDHGVFDFDGDGRDELLAGRSSLGPDNGGATVSTVEVLRSDGRIVTPYPVNAPYSEDKDVDGDGRPDLLWSGFFTSATCGLYPIDATGPSLLLHSLPDGTFSATDEVARRWAATECPAATKKGPTAAMGADFLQCAFAGACSRVWGASSAQVEKSMLAAGCGRECNAPSMIAEVSKWTPAFPPLDAQTPQPFPKKEMSKGPKL